MKVKRWAAALAVLVLLWTNTAWGETKKTMFEKEWYLQALKDSVMSTGNNARLKNVIARAQRGEVVTLATIGGSITEGAGAGTYQDCWAARFHDRFKKAYGAEDGSNVCFVNAGVGGTPSPFGYMRYQREIVNRVPGTDADGLPDIVVIEFSVNDWQEPTGHRCFESMVKEILDAPNEPTVILLFAVFRNGFNLQDELKKIGKNYDLMMVSIKDGFYAHIGKKLTPEGFFADVMGLKTIFGETETDEFIVERNGFPGSDSSSYRNQPIGQVCGKNFYHDVKDPMDPLTVKGVFRKCLVAWKATNNKAFGAAEILIDGKVVRIVRGGNDKWGQSEVALVLDGKEAAEHTLEIRVTEEGKKFTVTAISLQ